MMKLAVSLGLVVALASLANAFAPQTTTEKEALLKACKSLNCHPNAVCGYVHDMAPTPDTWTPKCFCRAGFTVDSTLTGTFYRGENCIVNKELFCNPKLSTGVVTTNVITKCIAHGSTAAKAGDCINPSAAQLRRSLKTVILSDASTAVTVSATDGTVQQPSIAAASKVPTATEFETLAPHRQCRCFEGYKFNKKTGICEAINYCKPEPCDTTRSECELDNTSKLGYRCDCLGGFSSSTAYTGNRGQNCIAD